MKKLGKGTFHEGIVYPLRDWCWELSAFQEGIPIIPSDPVDQMGPSVSDFGCLPSQNFP